MRPLTKKAIKVRILRRMLANVEADRPMLYGVQYKNNVDGEWDSRLYDISDRHFEVLELRIDPEEDMNTPKETFVIESEEDIKKLKEGAKVVLSNGEEVTFYYEDGLDGRLWFGFKNYIDNTIPYIALKGATVIQKRG